MLHKKASVLHKEAWCCIRRHRCCTPDGFPAFFLKSLAPAIAFPLSLLFEMSMSTGHIPLVWKTAFVCPVFKRVHVNSPVTIDLEHFEGNDFKVLRTLSNGKRTQFRDLFSERRGTNSGSKPSSAVKTEAK